jgi:hypothetical protein
MCRETPMGQPNLAFGATSGLNSLFVMFFQLSFSIRLFLAKLHLFKTPAPVFEALGLNSLFVMFFQLSFSIRLLLAKTPAPVSEALGLKMD